MEFDFKEYIKELQRRHVVKAGLAYLVGAWLILQVLDVLLPVFGLGESSMKVALAILSAGFPIWLVIAWVYDFSPEGIKKTEDVPFDPEVSRKKNIGLNRFIIGGLTIAVILLLVNTFRLSDKVEEFEGQFLAMEFTNSLAILPFEDLSPKQDQRYFSDGLSRSIYDQLARYKDLKLISPTSSFQYRDRDVSIEVIAEELGVRYILEGSVQLFGKEYRASINLVDTHDGSTIWSKTFEDSLENVLTTYDEVSDNIGNYLNVTMTSEDVRLRKVDPESYLLYLRANDTLETWNKRGALIADSLIRRSLEIDPTYAPSYACLSKTTLHKGLYYNAYTFTQALEMGLRAARKTIELDSSSVEGYAWLSNWQWHAKDARASNEALKMAQKLAPSNSGIDNYSAWQARRQNRITDCLKYAERFAAMDPKNVDPHADIAYASFMLEDYSRAEWALEEWHKLEDSNYFTLENLGVLSILKGEPDDALDYSARDTIKHSKYYIQSLAFHSKGDMTKSDSTLNLLKNLPYNEVHDLNTNFYLSMVHAFREENDLAFEYLERAEEYIKINLEWFFTIPEYKNLYDDPRWDTFIDRLSEEFNFDFPHRPE